MVTARHILELAERYARAEKNIELMTVSSRVFSDSKKLDAMLAGADITLKRANAAIEWFSDHWPDSAEWPSDVPRPVPSRMEKAS